MLRLYGQLIVVSIVPNFPFTHLKTKPDIQVGNLHGFPPGPHFRDYFVR